MIVQGRYDCCTPPRAAWDLHSRPGPRSELQHRPRRRPSVQRAGHPRRPDPRHRSLRRPLIFQFTAGIARLVVLRRSRRIRDCEGTSACASYRGRSRSPRPPRPRSPPPPASAQVTAARPLVGRGRASRTATARTTSERRYDEHRVRLEAGRRYRMTANSEAFDPVAAPLSRRTRTSRSPRMTIPARASTRASSTRPRTPATTRLRVAGFAADGARRLYARASRCCRRCRAGDARPAWRRGRRPGAPGRRRRSTADRSGARDGTPLRRLPLSASPRARRDSSALDARPSTRWSQVYRAERPRRRAARQRRRRRRRPQFAARFRAEEAGDYVIRVTALGDGTGAYRLRVRQ